MHMWACIRESVRARVRDCPHKRMHWHYVAHLFLPFCALIPGLRRRIHTYTSLLLDVAAATPSACVLCMDGRLTSLAAVERQLATLRLPSQVSNLQSSGPDVRCVRARVPPLRHHPMSQQSRQRRHELQNAARFTARESRCVPQLRVSARRFCAERADCAAARAGGLSRR